MEQQHALHKPGKHNAVLTPVLQYTIGSVCAHVRTLSEGDYALEYCRLQVPLIAQILTKGRVQTVELQATKHDIHPYTYHMYISSNSAAFQQTDTPSLCYPLVAILLQAPERLHFHLVR